MGAEQANRAQWPAIGYEILSWERDADELAMLPKAHVGRCCPHTRRPFRS